MKLVIENILDLIEISGEEEIRKELSAFSCPVNLEIEDFIKNKAIDFAKQKLSVTYLLGDNEDSSIIAYFTLAIKPLKIKKDSISKSLSKRIQKFALINKDSDTYTAAAFLLAQFGKNFDVENGSRITGNLLMHYVEETVMRIQHTIGVGLIYLDVEKNNNALINFYTNDHHYKQIDERKSATDGKEYIVMIKAI